MKPRSSRILLLLSLFVFLGTIAFHGCSGDKKRKGKDLKPIVEKVKRVDLKDLISNMGTLEAVVKVDLKSQASGRIDTMWVDEGAVLKKGQIILEIDPERLVTRKAKLKLRLRKAQLQLKMAKRDYDNAKELAKYGKVAPNAVEDLENKYELEKISADEIKLELRDVQKELDYTVIRSPMDGILISLDVEEGEIMVSAISSNTGGTKIGAVADVNKLEVATEVGEVDIPKVKMGMDAEISMASDPSRRTFGKVNFISMAAKQQSGDMVSNFKVKIAIDSLLEGMVPGINVNVDMILMEKQDVLGVPYSMVKKKEKKGKLAHTVIMADTKKPKRIEVGRTDYKYYEVLKGLKEGDKVMKKMGGKESGFARKH